MPAVLSIEDIVLHHAQGTAATSDSREGASETVVSPCGATSASLVMLFNFAG